MVSNAKSQKKSATKPAAQNVKAVNNVRLKSLSSLVKIITQFVSLIGLFLSMYALFVEYKVHLDSSYVAVCDISASISCSKVFMSQYGRIFSYLGVVQKESLLDQPNSLYGVGFYSLYLIILSLFNKSQGGRDVLLAMSVLASALSSYLAYILVYELHDICIVCYSTYAVNFVLFVCSAIASKSVIQVKHEKAN